MELEDSVYISFTRIPSVSLGNGPLWLGHSLHSSGQEASCLYLKRREPALPGLPTQVAHAACKMEQRKFLLADPTAWAPTPHGSWVSPQPPCCADCASLVLSVGGRTSFLGKHSGDRGANSCQAGFSAWAVLTSWAGSVFVTGTVLGLAGCPTVFTQEPSSTFQL